MKRRFWVILTALVLSSALCVSASAMSIFVELPGGEETVTLEVESGDSMDNVREKLAQKDARTAQWWLSYGGSYLAYGRTLGEYNIQKESTLQLNASKEVRVSTKDQVLSAVQDNAVQVVTLDADIRIDRSLRIARALTLDLNGHVLRYGENVRSSVILVEAGGQLTVIDSDPSAKHQFTPNADGLWVLDENGSKTVSGGVITGGTGKDTASPGGMAEYRGGGVYIQTGGSLTMEGGNIVGCTAHDGGGVCAEGTFTMNSGSIVGCLAYRGTENHAEGGGVFVVGGAFAMSGGSIRHCTAYGTPSSGGGVQLNNEGSFTLSGSAEIRGCRAIAGDYTAQGGGVYVSNAAEWLTVSGRAKIENCHAESAESSSKSSYGGGIYGYSMTRLTLANDASVAGCTAENGGALYLTGPSKNWAGGEFNANSGTVRGEVVLGEREDCPCTIQAEEGSGGTKFEGKVTVAAGSEIKAGQFKGEVINNGVISGGEFEGLATNYGTITGGELETVINCEGGTVAEGAEVSALYFVVTLDNEGTMTTENVPKDGLLPLPQVSLRKNYRLDGWYYTGEDHAEVKWNFAMDTVKGLP